MSSSAPKPAAPVENRDSSNAAKTLKKHKRQTFIPQTISVALLLKQILNNDFVAFAKTCTLKEFAEKLKLIMCVATSTTAFKSTPSYLDVVEFANLLVQLVGNKGNETQQSKCLHNFFFAHTSQLTSKPSSPKFEYIDREATEDARSHFLYTVETLIEHGHNQEDNIQISNTASRKKSNKAGKSSHKKDSKSSKDVKRSSDKEERPLAEKKQKRTESEKKKQTQSMDTDDNEDGDDAYESDQTNDESGY